MCIALRYTMAQEFRELQMIFFNPTSSYMLVNVFYYFLKITRFSFKKYKAKLKLQMKFDKKKNTSHERKCFQKTEK